MTVAQLTDNTMRALQLIDIDKMMEYNINQSPVSPIILNKFDLSSSDFIDGLSELVFADGNGADFIAKCQCGETEGNNKIGMICPECKTPVTTTNTLEDDNLICQSWLSCPREIPGGWLTPRIYLNLVQWLGYGRQKQNYLDDILDVDALLPFDIADVVKGQGFVYFHDNFDRIMNYFIYDHPIISKKPDTLSMKAFIQKYRDMVFCHYVPILNAAINPVWTRDGGGNNKRRYTDTTADFILSAAVTLSRIEFFKKAKNRHASVERDTFKAYKDIITYIEASTSKWISVKKAIPRTHIFGSRFHWSFRTVIVPIVGHHYYYELHVPWRMAVNSLRVQIIGILQRDYGLNLNKAVFKQRAALQIIDPDIKTIMNRLIEECKPDFPGLPCVWHRPPSIRDGSVTLKYWTQIKDDLNDSTIGMSPLDVALPNADFDGDQTY